MTNLQHGILILIKSALTNTPMTLPDDFDIEEAFKEIRRHHIVPIAYAGAVLCGVPKSTPAMQQMFQVYLNQMMQSERQMAAIARILEAFDKNSIDYLPLKGTTLKALYPKPEFRLMGDADILIKTDQYDRIKILMKDLGFTFKQESDHELVWKNDSLYVELHKHLIPSYNKDYFAYYNNGWQLTESTSNNTRHIFKSAEDEFVFLFTHFSKHYRDGGIGCRHIIDLYLYRQHNTNMNEKYIIDVLKKLQLHEFYINVLDVIDVWFNGGTTSSKVNVITEYIFSSGNWGNIQTHMMANIIKDTQTTKSTTPNKAKDFIHRALPDYTSMSYLYPILKKHPYLLPVFWCVRITTTVFCRRDLFNKKMEAYKASTDNTIQTFQDSLEYVGLKFNFKI